MITLFTIQKNVEYNVWWCDMVNVQSCVCIIMYTVLVCVAVIVITPLLLHVPRRHKGQCQLTGCSEQSLSSDMILLVNPCDLNC